MQIETIFKQLGKRKTINFIKNRGIKTLNPHRNVDLLIHDLSCYGLTDDVINDYILLKNHVDFYKWCV